MFNEKERFKNILGINDPIGIRNHYLRKNDQTLNYMENCGFLFDSTCYGMIEPFRVGDMWEFPISVMECYEVDKSKDLSFNLNRTFKILEDYLVNNMPFFVINFHDIYFNDNFPYYKNWYIELIKHCKNENLEFTTFKQAIQQLK